MAPHDPASLLSAAIVVGLAGLGLVTLLAAPYAAIRSRLRTQPVAEVDPEGEAWVAGSALSGESEPPPRSR